MTAVLRAFRLAFAAMLALPMVGCLIQESPPEREEYVEGTPREVSFLTMQLRPTFDDYMLGVIEKFEKLHPDVKVTWLDYPFQNYETKLMTSFMGDDPPDVINIGSETLRTYVEARILAPLEPLVSPETIDQYVPALRDNGGRVDGTLYAFPWYLTSRVTVMNKAMFEEAGIPRDTPPEFFEELLEICRVMREKTDGFGFFPIYTESGRLRTMLLEGGVPLLSPDRRSAAFNTPEGVEIFKFWTDLYRDRLVPSEAVTAIHRRPVELYKSGRLALANMGPEFLRQVKSDAPDVYANTAVGPKMHWRDHDVNFVALHVMTVSARARHPKLAAEFAAFLTNGANQLDFCRETTIIPSAVEALADPFFQESDGSPQGDARVIAARQAAKSGVYQPLSDSRLLYDVFERVTEKVCLGEMEADEGLRIAEEKWNEVLADHR